MKNLLISLRSTRKSMGYFPVSPTGSPEKLENRPDLFFSSPMTPLEISDWDTISGLRFRRSIRQARDDMLPPLCYSYPYHNEAFFEVLEYSHRLNAACLGFGGRYVKNESQSRARRRWSEKRHKKNPASTSMLIFLSSESHHRCQYWIPCKRNVQFPIRGSSPGTVNYERFVLRT